MFGRKPENILIIKTDGLAAFVAAEPMFDAIRSAHPRAKISLLTDAGLKRIAQAAPSYFNQVAVMPQLHETDARKAFVRTLKNARFGRVYDLSADAEGKRLQAAIGPFGPKWFAADPGARARRRKDAVETFPNFERLCSDAGIDAPSRLPDLSWAGAARKDAANMQPSWFGVDGPYGLMLPSSDEARRWPAAHYAALAKTMGQGRIRAVLAGGRELHGFCDAVVHETPEVVDLSGRADHLQLAAFAEDAAFFVSDGAEEMHLAMSVGCPGVVIRKAAEEATPPAGRRVVMLTVKESLAEAGPDFVWRTLDNMGLLAEGKGRPKAALR